MLDSRKAYEAEELYDIAILDIIMPEIQGPDLLKKLRNKNPKTKFIYVTGYDEVVEKAIHTHPFDLIKKGKISELKQALLDCLEELEQECQSVIIQGDKGSIEIEIRKVIYFEKNHNEVIFHLENQGIKKLRVSTKRVIEQLEESPFTIFCKINRGLYINMDKYERIEGSMIKLESEEWFPIAQRKKKETIEELRRYRLRKIRDIKN